MTKPAKIALRIVASLALLIIVGLVITLVMIDSVAKTGVEKGGTYALGVNTGLDKASIGLTSGKFGLSGLKVDNPQGFEGKFLALGDGALEVSLGSLMKDTVVVPRFALTNVELDLERNSSGANYNIILNNLKKLESAEKGDKAKPAEDRPGKQFKIGEIVISNVTVHLDLLGGPSGATKLTIPIHEIKLTNVGSDGSGVDIAELSSTILQAILAAAVDKGGSLIPADVMGDLNAGLSQLSGLADVGVQAIGKVGDQVTQLGGQLGKSLGDATKGVGDATKGVGDAVKGIGNIFESKDKKK
ncbi:MAG TPA: AsmA family protein [Phycisphaerales bacterium]|nr:AsmA family protein [Phycisphaerales bacterium]